ncbi:MAG: Nramp family divalent metal transporter [Pirellulaceae bacterium]|nr:Nramp family divalent metal transporter [Pirellulaceae bacterium]
MIRWLGRFRIAGPGLVVTAAFIGPGTVTVASQAGADYGYQLLWVLALATAVTIFLQAMATRIGLATRVPLGIAIKESLNSPLARWLVGALVVFAIGFGNSAFQAGNLTGARIGLEIMTGSQRPEWIWVLAAIASGTLFMSSYRRMEIVLIAMVATMSLGFLVTVILIRPEPMGMVRGLAPTFPQNSLVTILALLGTTIVPYNLFLHAGLVQRRWSQERDVQTAINEARADSVLSIGLGGLVSAAILVSAAVAFFGTGATLTSVNDMAVQLEPLLGRQTSRFFFGVGLFAAGLTSAITAPLAAAMAITGVLGWSDDPKAIRFRCIWIGVMTIGFVVAWFWSKSPKEIIVVAQAANGVLLPLVVGLLIFVCNRHQRLKRHRPSWWENAIAIGVFLIILGLNWNLLVKFFG